MRIPRTLLFLYLIIAASLANAQQFKVIKESGYYKLMLVDSGYFFSHGIENKKDFILDTNKIKKKDGVLRLPLLNGKEIVLKDTLGNPWIVKVKEYFYKGENTKLGYYFIGVNLFETSEEYLINKSNGRIDTLDNMPVYSPSYLFYTYGIVNHLTTVSAIAIKNLQSNSYASIDFDYHLPFELKLIKWINDYSFLCWIMLTNENGSKDLGNKYFLIEIKK